jgi:hypothetical protein
VLAVRSELRLQALDFWPRNPDYLADELVTEVEAGRVDPSYLDVASSLLTDSESLLRHYPMPRWLYGAYEPLDDAFAPGRRTAWRSCAVHLAAIGTSSSC